MFLSTRFSSFVGVEEEPLKRRGDVVVADEELGNDNNKDAVDELEEPLHDVANDTSGDKIRRRSSEVAAEEADVNDDDGEEEVT